MAIEIRREEIRGGAAVCTHERGGGGVRRTHPHLFLAIKQSVDHDDHASLKGG